MKYTRTNFRATSDQYYNSAILDWIEGDVGLHELVQVQEDLASEDLFAEADGVKRAVDHIRFEIVRTLSKGSNSAKPKFESAEDISEEE